MEGTGLEEEIETFLRWHDPDQVRRSKAAAFLSVRCTGLPCSSVIIDVMSWSVVVVLAVLLLVLLQVLLWQRRWRIRRELLTYGTRVNARVVAHDPARGDRDSARDLGRLLVVYRTAEGEEKRAVKTPQRRGDAWMAGEPAAVIYDPRRPNDAERLIVGFGRTKKKWFAARQQRAS